FRRGLAAGRAPLSVSPEAGESRGGRVVRPPAGTFSRSPDPGLLFALAKPRVSGVVGAESAKPRSRALPPGLRRLSPRHPHGVAPKKLPFKLASFYSLGLRLQRNGPGAPGQSSLSLSFFSPLRCGKTKAARTGGGIGEFGPRTDRQITSLKSRSSARSSLLRS